MDRLIPKRIDFDLAERIIASGPIKRTAPLKTKNEPREAATYRGACRNADRIKGWPAATYAKSRPLAPSRRIPLNRSSKWPHARTYQEAREIGPSSEPVR